MLANPTVPGSDIESIQKKHVDMAQRSRKSTTQERSDWARGKRLQDEIVGVFDRLGTQTERERMAAMKTCLRHTLWKECPDRHEGRLHQTQFCGNRLCPICQKRRAVLAKRKYRPALSQALTGEYTDGERLVALFVTVTWPSVGQLADDAVGQMWKDLGKLKRQAWWKSRVRGETWSFEWTFSPAYGHHPHAHGIILVPAGIYQECVERYKAAGISGKAESKRWWAENGPLPKPMLSEAWQRLTGASVVDVRLIKPRTKEWGNQDAINAALDETLKYPMKETDYLIDRKLRDDEQEEIRRRDGEIYDREQALVELYRAIRGRRLTDVRGCIRGKLLEALKEVEEATTEQLLRMDWDEMIAVTSRCSCCAQEYVEREYVYRSGRYEQVSENPLGTAFTIDAQASRILDMERQRQTARVVAKSAGRAWRRILRERREESQKNTG